VDANEQTDIFTGAVDADRGGERWVPATDGDGFERGDFGVCVRQLGHSC
jgi:hypothetical protein